jgi:hypothetical protein
MTEVALSSAKLHELKHYCDENGIDITDIELNTAGGGQRLKIIARIRQGNPDIEDVIHLVTEAVSPKEHKIEVKSIRTAQDNVSLDPRYVNRMRIDPRNPFPGKYTGDTVRIMIPRQDPKHEAGGDQPVIITVNSVNISVPRGEWVDLPYKFAVALANAKLTLYHNDGDRGLVNAGETYQYPFQSAG